LQPLLTGLQSDQAYFPERIFYLLSACVFQHAYVNGKLNFPFYNPIWRKTGVIETLAFRLHLRSKQGQHPRLDNLP